MDLEGTDHPTTNTLLSNENDIVCWDGQVPVDKIPNNRPSITFVNKGTKEAYRIHNDVPNSTCIMKKIHLKEKQIH
jgi:hypothetical protein